MQVVSESADLFRHVSAEKAALYRCIMDVFALAKRQYRLQLRPDEVLAEARWPDHPPRIEEINAALTQLVDWGNLESHPDTARVSSLGDFYRKLLSAPQTLNPSGTKTVTPKVEEVDGKWSVTEGGRTIEAYSLDTPHATGYVIPYVPDAKFGFVTDIWSPAPMMPPPNPGTISLVKGIQKMGIQMDKMAGGHGGVGNFADLAKTIPN